MRLKYDSFIKQWIGFQHDERDGYRCVVDRRPWRPLLFALTGRGFLRSTPFWTFRVEISPGVGRTHYADCSAGFFSRIGYIEVVQGVDVATYVFYRWLRIGIPRLGCLRIRLQKREI